GGLTHLAVDVTRERGGERLVMLLDARGQIVLGESHEAEPGGRERHERDGQGIERELLGQAHALVSSSSRSRLVLASSGLRRVTTAEASGTRRVPKKRAPRSRSSGRHCNRTSTDARAGNSAAHARNAASAPPSKKPRECDNAVT